MRKLILKALLSILKREIEKESDKYVSDEITQIYKSIATKDLTISTEIVHAKKGTRRYTLVFFKDKNLNTKFNLGRYWGQSYNSIIHS